MIERHGSLVLLVGGIGLVVVGVLADDSATRVALCVLGAGLVVFAVVLPRLERFKAGPGGFEGQLRARQQEAISDSQSLSDAFGASGLDLLAVATGRKTLDDTADPEAVKRELSSLLDTLRQIDTQPQRAKDPAPAEALLEAARGLMAGHAWVPAAEYLDRYVQLKPDDWDAHFARAVAHANARGGDESNRAALRAYNDAIALAPPDIEPNLLARLLSYRGAMYKRLERLAEAEADLNAAAALATHAYERADIDYNLACVYAMTGRRDEAMKKVHALSSTKFIGAIRANADRYFAALLDDPEFRDITGLS